MEPWLDSLSEDWNSLPRSNISPTTSPASAQPIPSAAKKLPTKIPRPKSNNVTSSPLLRQNPRATASERRRQGLSERRASDINISAGRPRTASGAKQASPLDSPYSSSPASKGSVIRHQQSTRRSRSSSPSKRKPHVTPEWKKLALRHAHEPTSQKDLFSPLPLEGLFQAPQNTRPLHTHGLPQPTSDMTMPSSPPPWPANHRGAKKSFVPTKSRLSYGELKLPSALGSQDDTELDDGEPGSGVEADGQNVNGLIEDPSSISHMDEATTEEPAKTEGPFGSRELQATETVHDALQDATATLQNLVEDVSKSYLSSDGANTASSSGFSPVFISKHNNVDGNVDYAALDTSNPAVLERLRQLATQSRAQSSRNPSDHSAGGKSSQDPSTARSVVEAGAQEAQTPEIVTMSNFVSVKRGGLSEDDSFLRRPMSSSASSLVPSDSVSQTFGRSRRGFGRSPLATAARRVRRSLSADAADERGPRTPDRAVVDGDTGEIRHHQPSSPLKLFGNYDTFTNNRLLRRMSRLEDADKLEAETKPSEEDHDLMNAIRTTETPLSSNNSNEATKWNHSFEGSGETDHVTPATDNNWAISLRIQPEPSESDVEADESVFDARIDPRDQLIVKRPGSAPIKPPTPKRLRTLHKFDIIPGAATNSTTPTEAVQDRHHHMQAIIGKKRKDARYDQHPHQADPQEVARRQIIQPRNSSSQPMTNPSDQQLQLAQSTVSTQSRLEVVKEHIEQISLPPGFSNAPIRALASEVASFRFKNPIILNGEVRKGSVSTQDYLDEAMKIMEMIRSKARPESGLAYPGPLMLDGARDEDDVDTSLTISRPPSRDGQPSVWRTRNDQELDPQLVSHLQQYQEADDESFMVESMTRSLDMIEEGQEPEPPEADSEPLNARISQPIQPQGDDLSTLIAPPEQMTHRTHSSRPSTDSTGRTIGTTSSQRTRNLAVIAPEKVSHLISGEEAGMRFDTEKKIWVKFKPRQTSDAEDKGSSSTVEEDPFDQIPDLSVNEAEEQDRIYSTYRKDFEAREAVDDYNHDSQDVHAVERSSTKIGLTANKVANSMIMEQQLLPLEVTPDDSAVEDSCEVPTTDPLPVYPSDTVRSKQRRDVSVLFSSPVVTHWQDADEWQEENSEVEDSAMLEVLDDVEQLSSPPEPIRRTSSRHHLAAPVLQSSVVRRHYDRTDANVPIAEQHEVSLIETRPDGRTMSLTLSVSTPVQRPKWSNRRAHASSQVVNRYATYSLSPLSEFTVHQDDAEHLQTTNLAKGLRSASKPPTREHTALAVGRLVEKITDAEPSELFWDSMHSLKLREKDLDTVVMLGELCPELEALDIGANRLSQLVGVPPSVRHLDAQLNRLDNLTTWGHLRNLQYLNVSGNALMNCNGFSDLIHLRELKADQCHITDIEGLFDLDGLLKLSLKGNALRELDFTSSMLSRLSWLDVSDNAISNITGLEHLAELTSLDVSGNKLTSFRNADSTSMLALETLDLSRNCLSSLSVAHLHGLRALYADDNYLASIHGIAHLQCLSTLSLRNQVHPAGDAIGLTFSSFSNLHHLYLSNNSIAALDLDDTPFLNLQTLDMSCTGLQILPEDINSLCPNLRTLNLNSNALKDLKHLRGLRKLRTLHAAGNRVSRLRRTLTTVASLPELQELDLRDNPLTLGMYAPTASSLQVQDPARSIVINGLMHTLASADAAFDAMHETRLDEPTRLRRRVYALLMTANMGSRKSGNELARRQEMIDMSAQSLSLKYADGLPIEAWCELARRRDIVWEQLVDVGVVERVGAEAAS